jgi:hypothetical protein
MTGETTYDVTITVPGASAPVTMLQETGCASVTHEPADSSTGKPARWRVTKGTTTWEIHDAPGMVVKVSTNV